MKLQFGEGACQKTREYLDSYISNELLVETNHEVLRHVENCPACAAELDARARLRARLKAAVNAQSVPAGLPALVRERLHAGRPYSFSRALRGAGWPRLALSAAAGLVVAAGLWWNGARENLPALSDRPAQGVYIRKISASLAAVLRVGLADHIHCSIFRKYPQNPPALEKMESDLGPSYQGLLPVVRAAFPPGYRILMAHQCSYAGRKYVHLTLEKDGQLLSLVVARKNPGESMGGLSSAAEPSGIPVYQSAAGRYVIAGFEAGNFLAFVVSDLERGANLQIAAGLAPRVHEFLMNQTG